MIKDLLKCRADGWDGWHLLFNEYENRREGCINEAMLNSNDPVHLDGYKNRSDGCKKFNLTLALESRKRRTDGKLVKRSLYDIWKVFSGGS